MSFKKLQIISPQEIGSPEYGHIYFGRDNNGLWEKYSNGVWVYITTGTTTGSGTSGTSGDAGSSGVDGTFLGSSGTSGIGSSGTSGISGSSGKSGTHGTSGSSGVGTSGSSGITGSSGFSGSSGTSSDGSSGTSGFSGSSGVDGDFYGSSGTSGYNGGYGAATRRWISTLTYPPLSNGNFHGTSGVYGGFNFSLMDKIIIKGVDADNNILNSWLNNWQNGILKIEKYNDPQYFGIYDLVEGWSSGGGGIYIFTGLTCKAGNGDLIDSEEYLISFINNSNNYIQNESSWILISNNDYNSVPISISGITTIIDYSNLLGKGTSIRWLSGSTYYYNEIIDIDSNTISVRGASLGDGECISNLWYSFENIINKSFIFSGSYANVETENLINDWLLSKNGYYWKYKKSSLVGMDIIHTNDDTTASIQPSINAIINSNVVFNNSLTGSTSLISSNNFDNEINVSNYVIDYNDTLEIKVDVAKIGPNNDSENLTCYISFILENLN